MPGNNPNQNNPEGGKPKSGRGFPGMGIPADEKPKTSQQVGEARRHNTKEPRQHKDGKKPF